MQEFEAEVRKLVPEDGDVLVIRVQRKLSLEQATAIHGQISELIGLIGKKVTAIILDDGMSIEVLKTSALQDAEVAV